MREEVHFHCIWTFESNACHRLAAKIVTSESSVFRYTGRILEEGCCQQFIKNALDIVGVLLHGIDDSFQLFVRNGLMSHAEHLREANDDVERCTHLMGEVLHEGYLLFEGLLCLSISNDQCFITLFYLVIHMLNVIDVA